jgi:flavin reductase (DIM6/NTAB) family NADH-FMN oxidoreductase RutF
MSGTQHCDSQVRHLSAGTATFHGGIPSLPILATFGFPVYATDMAIDPGVFRAAMGQMASGVTVITMHVDDQDHGFTASSFTSLSLDPMLVLVCVAKAQRSHLQLERAGHFAVNILACSQKELGVRFADPLQYDHRFDGLELARAATGAPILPNTVAWVDCCIRDLFPGGDHSIFVGEVSAGFATPSDDALVYHKRQWGRFAGED